MKLLEDSLTMAFLSSLIKIIKQNLLLTIFVVVGLLLRVISVNPGYYLPIGDELLFGQALHMIIDHTLAFESPYFGFPPLIPWIMIPIFTTIFIPATFLWSLIVNIRDVYIYIPIFISPILIATVLIKRIFKLTKANTLKIFLILAWTSLIIGGVIGILYIPMFKKEILGRDWINALYWGRYLAAFIGTGAIIATYKVAQVFFNNKNVSLLSALFVAVNYRLVLSSHVGLPDMYNVLFLLLALLAVGHLIKKRSIDQYVITILAMATFFMIKYQTQVLIPFIVTHIGLSLNNIKGSFLNFLKNIFNKGIIFGGLLGIIYILIAHYHHFVNIGRVLEINHYEAIKYGFGRNLFDIFPISYLYHVGIGPIISITSILGLILAIIYKKTRFAAVVLISTLPMFIFLYLYYTNGGYYTRNLMSAIPIILIFSAFAINILLEKLIEPIIKSRILFGIIVAIVAFLVVKENIFNSIVAASSYSKEASRVTAQKWINKNIGLGLTFGRYSGNPSPVNPEVEVRNMTPYYRAISYRELLTEKYEYVEIDITYIRDFFTWWTRQGPNIAKRFWNKPDDLLSQNYISLAFRELMWTSGQALFISPWQAPSDNFGIAFINKNQPVQYSNPELIKKYTDFSNDWTPLSYMPNNQGNLLIIGGTSKNKVLQIKDRNFMPGSLRFQSKNFVIKPGYGYKIVVKIRNDNAIQKDERDGFMRLDFYKNDLTPNILSRSITSFVSERIYGDPSDHTVVITGIAPDNANFANVGFQADGNSPSSFYLNEVDIYQTKTKVPDLGKHILINDSDLFLPNNAGIL